jgi:hypothetical protein
MFKRNLSLPLVGSLILSLAIAPCALANSKAEKEAAFTVRVKTGVAKIGVGRDARVEVKLRDKTKLKGYISEAADETFSITDLKTGATTTVAYPDVAQVKAQNLSTGEIIVIAAGVAVGVTLLVIWLIIASNG